MWSKKTISRFGANLGIVRVKELNVNFSISNPQNAQLWVISRR